MVVRMLRRIQGSWLYQFGVVQRAFNASLSLRCILSTKPLDCGWYAVVWFSLIPRVSDMPLQRAEVNCGPLSEVMILGTPKRETQLYMSAVQSAGAVVSVSGIASGHLVYRSRMVKR